MENQLAETNRRIATFRKAARILGAIITVFLLVFGIGEMLEARGRASSQPLELISAIGLGLLVLYGAGLVAAFKWERLGALLAAAGLGATFVMLGFRMFPGGGGGFGLMGVLNPFLLFFWVPVILYVLSWRLESRRG